MILSGPARQVAPMGSVLVHHVDLRRTVAVRLVPERDPFSVGRPGGIEVRGRIIRELPRPSPVRVHDVDVLMSVRPGRECDPSHRRARRARRHKATVDNKESKADCEEEERRSHHITSGCCVLYTSVFASVPVWTARALLFSGPRERGHDLVRSRVRSGST